MGTNRAGLWAFLESHRDSAALPTLDELRSAFGEPDEILDDGNEIAPGMWGLDPEQPWYARYGSEERKQDWIAYVEWAYHHAGDADRYVGVLSRAKDGTVLGWHWFENVPEGRESGPPRA